MAKLLTDEQKQELVELQAAMSRLGQWRNELMNWKSDYTRAMSVNTSLTQVIGKRINELKSGPDESITDHALMRYLERYTEVDIEEIREKIRQLPELDKVVINHNTITVGPNVGVDAFKDPRRT